MSTINDNRIMDLIATIEKKEQSLKRPIVNIKTNCNIEIDGKRHNLHILDEDMLTYLLVKLNTYVMSAKDLSISIDAIKINGFKLQDWIDDIKTKLELCAFKKEEKKLSDMKEQLHVLLSEDKRTELALDSIEAELNK